jgi:hypothetical protein
MHTSDAATTPDALLKPENKKALKKGDYLQGSRPYRL